jgi:general stress protein YciG
MSREEAGRRGCSEARHAISEEEESGIARKAARTRKKHDPDAFQEMGRKGNQARHKNHY